MSFAIELAEKANSICLDKLPKEAVHVAKRAIADTIGVAIAGSKSDFLPIIENASSAAPKDGLATKFGQAGRLAPLDAAFINGIAAHALDFDDCSTTIGGHPSAPIVPALIALGESRKAGGKDILQAYITGFEVETHLARAVMPYHYEKGWHPTATLGVFGAAAACGRLLGLDTGKLATALAISTSLVCGHKANFGTPAKPLHVGQAARNGLMAALLADGGMNANLAAFEHDQGFFSLYGDGEANLSDCMAKVLDDWEGELEILKPGISIKQHPCCGSAHSAIDAARKLYQQFGPFDRQAVDNIEIAAHRRRLQHTNRPKPQDGLAAKFSVQFLTSKALCTGSIRLEDFVDGAFMKPQIVALSEGIVVTPHERDDEFLAEVNVTMSDGSRHSANASTRLGRGPENPMSDRELEEKFLDCSGNVLGQSAAQGVFEDLMLLDHCGSIAEITARLSVCP